MPEFSVGKNKWTKLFVGPLT
eukprot:Gb_09181 [translate_table: standard]